ncbi:lipopolysaccharide heptosyltransferase II [Helicobacter cetorum]|uniref:lipopolysaccharide heptosyltransferase II n=1 Tax=Helicobacter cetorum TaxID=138563 RepID=UPI000CF0F36F|nr:lipopolysaccharide heptosyltransferase II [Helicobacter cetorum]
MGLINMRILLRLPNWLGDAVMASPLFYTLKDHYPNARFVLVGTKIACELFAKNPQIERCFVDTTKQSRFRLLATYKLAKQIGTCDLAITLTNNLYSASLLYSTKTPIRIGFAKNLRSFLLTHAIGKPPKDYHQVERYCFLFSQYLKQDLNRKAILPLRLPFILETKTPHAHKKIGFSPSASYGSAKRWLSVYYAKVASALLEYGHEIYFFGAKADTSVSEEILGLTKNRLKNQELIHNAYNLCGKTSIEELVKDIASLDLFITNDSGPMHVSASVETPLIALFGPTDMRETNPWKAKNAILLNHNLPCAPCKKRTCPLKDNQHHLCMRSIKPEEVLTHAFKILSKKD